MTLREPTNKVNVTSREMIKPSSPTPADKNTFKLSLIDQLATNKYGTILLFYQKDPLLDNNSTHRRSMLLKKSLSQILVDFYPLAGRVQRNELIDCSDQGAEFCEAHLSEELNRFIESNPSLDDLCTLLPFRDNTPQLENKNIVLSVQLNHFSCGGTAFGMCLHHKIADAAACVDFLKAWTAMAAHGVKVDERNHILRPKFIGASLFPPANELNELNLLREDPEPTFSKKRIAMRRLIFDKKAINELKAETIAANTNIGRLTRVEVVTAFICKHWPYKFSSIEQIVNMRKRVVPSVPEDFFGNCAWVTRTSYNPEFIIDEFRNAIEKISGYYLKDILSSDNLMMRLKKEFAEKFCCPEEIIMCNSHSGFPFYEMNFGMGNPFWVCTVDQAIKNGFLTMSTECGQGIEAWVGMLEDEIDKFDHALSQLDYPILMPLKINY